MPEGAGAMFDEAEKRREDGEFVELQEQNDGNGTLYFVTPPLPDAKGASAGEERRVLSRLPLLAVFHGVSHERGVPPSFTGFLRQWPSLPTFGVFLTTRVLPVPHVDDGDRTSASATRLPCASTRSLRASARSSSATRMWKWTKLGAPPRTTALRSS